MIYLFGAVIWTSHSFDLGLKWDYSFLLLSGLLLPGAAMLLACDRRTKRKPISELTELIDEF
jgi:hypothetical protein